MAIGLTSGQLLNTYLDSSIKRLNEIETEKTMAEMGINPRWKELETALKDRYPALNFEQFMTGFTVVAAFMDCIVRNNEALAKVIPHVGD